LLAPLTGRNLQLFSSLNARGLICGLAKKLGFRLAHPPWALFAEISLQDSDDRPARAGKRLLILGSYAPSLVNFRGPLIAAAVARGHRVFAAAPAIDAGTAEALRALGAEPLSINLARTSLNPFLAARTVSELKALVRKLEPDVIFAYTIKPIVLGARAAGGVPRFVALVTGLGYAFTGGRHPRRLLSRLIAKALYRRAFARASVAIFQNPDDREEFRRLGLLPAGLPTYLVAGSGVDLDLFRPAPLPDQPSFLMIARLLGDKGVREYADAAARLKRAHPGVRLMLAGWLDESPDSIAQSELDDAIACGVEYLGRLDDVRPAIATASVYVLPSYREGTPRSVLEAMAMGRAIITSDAPGCRQTVEKGVNGFLVPPRDADSLYRAMERLVLQPELIAPMGAQSQRMAVERFDARRVAEELLEHAQLS